MKLISEKIEKEKDGTFSRVRVWEERTTLTKEQVEEEITKLQEELKSRKAIKKSLERGEITL